MMVARRPMWLRPVWFLLTPLHYRRLVYGKGLLRRRTDRVEAWGMDAAIVAVILGSILVGGGTFVVQAWILPAVIAILWLALAFDLLPHLPHTTQERYYDTRIYPGRVLNFLFLGQNYHLVHHLWTTIPWYRYQRAYLEIEPDLRERRAPIGWDSRAVAP